MNKRRKMIKRLCIAMIFIMVLGVIPYENSGIMVVQAASSTNRKAMKAYKKFLEKKKIVWYNNGSASTKAFTADLKFTCLDINKDSVKELLIYNTKGYHATGFYRIYGYINGKVKLLCSMGDKLTFYPNKKLIKIVTIYPSYYSETYYQMDKKGKMIDKLSRVALTDLEDKNKAEKTGTKFYKEKIDGFPVYFYGFTLGDEKISYSKSKRELKKLLKNAKKVKMKYHQNNKSNRSKYLK